MKNTMVYCKNQKQRKFVLWCGWRLIWVKTFSVNWIEKALEKTLSRLFSLTFCWNDAKLNKKYKQSYHWAQIDEIDWICVKWACILCFAEAFCAYYIVFTIDIKPSSLWNITFLEYKKLYFIILPSAKSSPSHNAMMSGFARFFCRIVCPRKERTWKII